MATVVGTRLTLSDTIGIAVDMSPVIQLIDPYDVGLLSYFGLASLSKEATETKHSWMEDTLRPLTGALDGTGIAGAGTLTFGVTAGTGVNYRAGDVILVESELIRLSADPSTDTLTSIASPNGRGWGGTTAAAHAALVATEIVSVTIPEGQATPGLTRTTVKTQVDNYTQIFEDVVQISSTLEAVEQWNAGSEYARQLGKTMKSLLILMDKTFIYGKVAVRAAANGNTGGMGGLRHFITTNVTAASSAQLSEKLCLDALFQTYTAGGNVKVAVMTLTQKRALNRFLDPNRRTGMDDRRAGAIVDTYLWDHGLVDTLIDRWMPQDEVMFLDSEYIGFGPLRGSALRHEILPKPSLLVQKGEIVGEYTCEVKSQTAHARITGLATTII